MASIMDVKDVGLRNALWGFQEAVRQKAAKKNWRPSQDPDTWLLENGRPSQARESARLARIRQGEPEPEDR